MRYLVQDCLNIPTVVQATEVVHKQSSLHVKLVYKLSVPEFANRLFCTV